MKKETMEMASAVIDLAGEWKLSMGESRPSAWPDTIRLPGSLQAQGFGDPVTPDTKWTGQIVDKSWYTDDRYAPYREPGNIKIPFWLQPERHYVGVAWMERAFDIPAVWSGRRIVLFLERAHIMTSVWVEGRKVGSRNTLGAPHVYDLGCALAPGRHVLTISVDNRVHINVGPNAHSISDHTQTNWNGIVGRLELRATSPVWMEDVQLFPDVKRRSVRSRVTIGNATGKRGRGVLDLDGVAHPVEWGDRETTVEFDHRLPDNAALWDEFTPTLHALNLTLTGDDADDARRVTFGLRELGVDGTQITINGRKTFLRGTLDCAAFPHDGYPPADTKEWKRIFGILRDYGFNHVRFHSWCPPEAAFEVADEMGFYLQVECSSWANSTTGLGHDEALDAWLYEEGRAIVKAYGNHPSFMFMTYGNEPWGERMEEFLTAWLKYWKAAEPRRLHTSAAGWPELEESQYDNVPQPRLHRWGEGLNSRLNDMPPSTATDFRLQVRHSPRPIISHEAGQWCAYPDLSEIDRCTGVLRARNFEIFRDSLKANHMSDQARDFLMASGKLQALCYREEIESALRTNGFGGYQLLSAADFPGQGTAPVGWLNALWEEKGYTTAREFRRFQGPTVLLARMERRVFSVEDTFRATIEMAHFGPAPLAATETEWSLRTDTGGAVAGGRLPSAPIAIGNGIRLGEIVVPLEGFKAPSKYRLVVGLVGQPVENDWEIWVYPLEGTWDSEGDVVLTRKLDDVVARSETGGKVLFLPERQAGDVQMGFSSIFWNTSWTRGQPPHTLGILCDPAHPIFDSFPTEYHSNWQWWEVLDRAKALIMDPLPPNVRPIVQVIDDWFTSQRLGLAFEVRIGKARVLVCGADLQRLTEYRHAARQFRKSAVEYMRGDRFAPSVEISAEDLKRAVTAQSPYARVEPR